MLHIFSHCRFVYVLVLCVFLVELMNPTSPFVRSEPSPTKKIVKVETGSKTFQTTSDDGAPDLPLAGDDTHDDDNDDAGVIHCHAWADLGSIETHHPLQLITVIDFFVRDLMSDGVIFPTIDPPSFA